ncbi:MAG: hypothetical protein ABSD74_17160 [Rhizomicrobium sp.]|jgi:hypothetical protein
MTLVVGRVAGRRVAVVSDTCLTEHNMALPTTSGVVKTAMLPGGICVSFSNSPELAAADFMAFARLYPEGCGYAEAIAYFERASENSGNDYLIAFAKYTKLVKIADGKRVNSVAKTQWIGDQSAYERFREYESKARIFPEAGRAINGVLFADEIDKSPASDLYSTMRRVISDREMPNVGGFAYVVSDRLEHFRQSVYCDMLFDWPASAAEQFNLQLNDQIDLGASGENRQFSIAQASPGYLGLNLAVFYLLAAKKLFVFGATTSDPVMRCRTLSDVEPQGISGSLKEHCGQDWNWLIQVMSVAPDASSTRFREIPVMDGPSGLKMSFYCHVNTFPRTAAA